MPDTGTAMTCGRHNGILRSVRPTIVGRLQELSLMEQLLDALEDGSGNLVLVGGEVGIGKTTLVEAVGRMAQDRGAFVISGASFDLTAGRLLGPWFDLLSGYQQDEGLPAIPPSLTEAKTRPVDLVQPDIFNDFWSFLCELSDIQPLVIIFEDWHGADSSSLDLLRILSRQVPQRQILVLLTYRNDELSVERPMYQMLPVLIREARAVRVDLRMLDRNAIRELIQKYYALEANDEIRLTDWLVQTTQGNALFVVELLRVLEIDQHLQKSDDSWTLKPLGTVPVPPLIRQVVDRRLTVLGDDVRSALELAATIGLYFYLDHWQAVGEFSDEQLSKVITLTRGAYILEQLPDGQRLRFSHPIVREALYESIVPPQRLEWHRRIAETLAHSFDVNPEIIAFHFARADDHRVSEWLVRAGDHERVSRDFNAAFGFYEAALQISEITPELLRSRGWLLYRLADTRIWIDERQGLIYLEAVQEIADKTCDSAMQVAVSWLRGKLRTLLGEDGYPDLEAAAEQLAKLTGEEREELSGILVRDYEIEAAEEFVYRALANYSSHYGRYQEALRRAKPYLDPQTGREEHAPDHHISSALGVTYAALGRPDQARMAFEDAIAVNRRKGHYSDMANLARIVLRDVSLVYYSDWLPERKMLVDTVVSAYSQSLEQGGVLDLSPRWGTLPVMLVEGEWNSLEEIAKQLIDRGGHWRRAGAPVAGQHARFRGHIEYAWDCVKTAFPDGAEVYPHNQYYDAYLPIQRLAADLALDAGEYGLAHSWIESYAQWLGWSGRVQGQVELHLLRARYYRLLVNTDAASDNVERALDLARNPRQPLALMEAHRFGAELALASRNLNEARFHIDQSLDLAEQCKAVFGRAQALVVRAEIGLVSGDNDRARADLRVARSVCNELGALPLLDAIAALSRRSRSGTSSRLDGTNLTARELQVLEHVSDGLTDAEIATLLYISPRTVNQHLRSLYLKLDVHNRASAVIVATDRGLLN